MATNLATILVELRTNTKGFNTQIESAKKKTKQFGDKTADVNKKVKKGQSKIQESFRKTSQSIAAIQGPLGPVAGRITSLGTIIGNVGLKAALFTVGIAAATFALKAIVGVVGRAEQQFLKLEAILKATGNSAGLSMQEIQNLSAEIGIATLASTQKVRDAAGILLTFKSVQGDVFRDALKLTQDLAEVGFGDLKTGATQLGKALEEPIVGLGALRRVGVSFSDTQKEQIKLFELTGQKVKAQEIILKALNEQVGGAGVKAATGLSGAVDSLQEKFVMFFEQTKTGKLVVDLLTRSLNFLSDKMGEFDKEATSLNTFKEVEDSLAKIRVQFEEAQKKVDGIFPSKGDLDRYEELKVLISEHIARLEVLRSVEERNLNKKKKGQSEEEKELTTLEKLAEQNALKREMRFKREIEDLGKTQVELKELNEIRKIEDALLAKIGSMSKKAQEVARDEAEKQKKIVKETIASNQVLIDQQERLNKAAAGVGSMFQSVGEKINDAMARGKLATLDFTDILREMIVEIQKMIFKIMVLDEIQKKIEDRIKKGGGSDFLGNIIGSIFGNKKPQAGGGSTQNNSPRLVGERGPELFVPNAAGKIVNGADTKSALGGGGGVSVVQNLNFAVGITNTVRAEVMNMLPAIQQSTLSAVADAKQRGGKFSKAFGA
tara:strand:- start:640 stop:2625 length:1986 start_codon:yes stop_codon:yes gene_type:complete